MGTGGKGWKADVSGDIQYDWKVFSNSQPTFLASSTIPKMFRVGLWPPRMASGTVVFFVRGAGQVPTRSLAGIECLRLRVELTGKHVRRRWSQISRKLHVGALRLSAARACNLSMDSRLHFDFEFTCAV